MSRSMQRVSKVGARVVVLAAAGVVAVGLTVYAAPPSQPTTQPPSQPTTVPVVTPATAPALAAAVPRGERGRRNRGGPPMVPGPTSAPSVDPTPIPAAYRVVLTRSIFVHGDQTVGDGGSAADAAARASRPSGPVRPEATMVFTGVTMVDGLPRAIVEDAAAHTVATLKVGDPLASGKVAGITFDDLDYQPRGRTVVHVALGQNLDAVARALDDATAPVAGPPPAAAPPGPGGTPTPPPVVDPAGSLGNTAGLSNDDILAKMRRRRQQEQGGK